MVVLMVTGMPATLLVMKWLLLQMPSVLHERISRRALCLHTVHTLQYRSSTIVILPFQVCYLHTRALDTVLVSTLGMHIELRNVREFVVVGSWRKFGYRRRRLARAAARVLVNDVTGTYSAT